MTRSPGHLTSAVLSVHPLRLRLAGTVVEPHLLGVGREDHLALTFDDGPDPASTPHLLDVLVRHGVRATFFLLGAHVAASAGLVKEMHAAGHELAVHGWSHRPAVFTSTRALTTDLRRTRDVVEDLTQAPVQWYRPPYGVLSPSVFEAAARTALRPVLWTSWGRDWERRATPDSVVATLRRTLLPGGTVLLHDTDRTAAPGSWRTTLAALPALLDCAPAALGPLRDHGVIHDRGGRVRSPAGDARQVGSRGHG